MEMTWKPTCNAEVGRPGNLHGCHRVAKYRVYTRRDTILYYCEKHKSRASDVTGLRHSGARSIEEV